MKLNFIFLKSIVVIKILSWALTGCASKVDNVQSFQVFTYNSNDEPVYESQIYPLEFGEARKFFAQRFSDVSFDETAQYYRVRAVTMSTGGYQFIGHLDRGRLRICLKSPGPHDAVTMAMTNPSAIVLVPAGVTHEIELDGECR